MYNLDIKNKINDLIKRVLNKDISVWIKDQEIENRIDWIDLNVEQVIQNIENK